jgi:dolichyl-phosphate-mannose--protein O-mannosyl transferase
VSADVATTMPSCFCAAAGLFTVCDVRRSPPPARPRRSFWYTALKLNRRMIVHNAAILAPHHWQSKWHEWLLVSDARAVNR